MPKRLFAALACTFTAACAGGQGDYPSLAIRDAERVSGTLQAPEPFVPAPISPAALADVRDLVAQARSAQAAYRDKLPSARSAAQSARGAGFGSDSWARASVAIAGLETERSRVMLALAEIDRLYVSAATEGRALEELAAAQDEVAGIATDQTATINDLLAGLR